MSDPAIRLNVALKGRYAIERELGEGAAWPSSTWPMTASPSVRSR